MLDAILKALARQAQINQGGKVQPDGSIVGGSPWGSGYSLTCSVAAPYVLRCVGTPGVDPQSGWPIVTDQHVIGWLVPTPGHDTIAFPARDANGVATSNEPDDTCFAPAPRIVFDPKNPVCPLCGKGLVL